MIVNPVVTQSADREHVRRVEDVTAASTRHDFVHIDWDTIATMSSIKHNDPTTGFADRSTVEYFYDEPSPFRVQLSAFC